MAQAKSSGTAAVGKNLRAAINQSVDRKQGSTRKQKVEFPKSRKPS